MKTEQQKSADAGARAAELYKKKGIRALLLNRADAYTRMARRAIRAARKQA
jgi:hypothetical protein